MLRDFGTSTKNCTTPLPPMKNKTLIIRPRYRIRTVPKTPYAEKNKYKLEKVKSTPFRQVKPEAATPSSFPQLHARCWCATSTATP